MRKDLLGSFRFLIANAGSQPVFGPSSHGKWQIVVGRDFDHGHRTERLLRGMIRFHSTLRSDSREIEPRCEAGSIPAGPTEVFCVQPPRSGRAKLSFAGTRDTREHEADWGRGSTSWKCQRGSPELCSDRQFSTVRSISKLWLLLRWFFLSGFLRVAALLAQ